MWTAGGLFLTLKTHGLACTVFPEGADVGRGEKEPFHSIEELNDFPYI